jgi:hypothetical protein
VQESESYKGISRDVILDIYNKVWTWPCLSKRRDV